MKGVWMHGLFALVALGLAYTTWTREDEADVPAGQVVVMDCSENNLGLVEVETRSYRNVATPRTEAGERTYWISSERKPKPPPEPEALSDGGVGDAGVAGPAESTPESPKPPQVFVANAKFDSYLETLMPLRAVRALGTLDAARQSEFGFDKVDTFMTLTCGGRSVELEVGGRTYGSGQRYLRRKDTGEVYLMPGSVVQDMQSARYKFKQAELHRFDLADVDAATVSAAGQVRELLHRNRKQPKEARWVDAAEPDKRNELFGNWFSRVGRLRARDYLGQDVAPGSDLDADAGAPSAPEPVVEVAYVAGGKPLGKLELVSVRQGEQRHYYARTETTRTWVSLHASGARLVADDAALVVGAEQSDSAPEAPAPGPNPHTPHTGLPAGHPPTGGPHGRTPGGH